MKKHICLILFCALIPYGINAQKSYEEFQKKVNAEYSSFKTSNEKEFEDFRNKINAEYANMVKKAWKELNAIKGTPKPDDDKPIPPIIYPEEDKNKLIKDNSKPFEEIIPIVKPQPQPEPVVPIIYDSPKPVVETYFQFKFYNTSLKVRLNDSHRFSVNSCKKKDIAKIWSKLSGNNYNSVINDCLGIRSQIKLCDWAYLLMLRDLCDSFFNGHCNESVLLTAFLYCQSGYKMRLAHSNGQLFLLYASKNLIYDQNYWVLDGEKYYPLDCNNEQISICQASFPNEKPLSLHIVSEQLLAMQTSTQRTLQSKRYPDVKAEVNTNENLIKFFNSYPTGNINESFGSRWAMYANTPLSEQAKNSLYPSLKKAIANKSEIEAANKLLNFVQTAFVYEYDNKVWGCDRAFFADETLYYPYCDCEDRSILFSRLIQDLLGLDVVLIYYPGHLATAVKFTENVSGDYFKIGDNRYTVCDPTYIGAPVGATMTKMNNNEAKIILLK